MKACDRQQDFGERFITLAQSVYRHNDLRASIKRQLNELMGARFREQNGRVPLWLPS